MKQAVINGKIYVEKGTYAQALMVEDGVITCVGTEEEVRRSGGDDCDIYDCQGRTVIPGLNDTHLHFLQFGMVLNRAPIEGSRSVEEVVQSGVVNRLGRRLFPGREEKQRARQQMERLEIWEMRKRPYRALSGGQQQRVLLARALCATDSLLLLDEPVTGLDPETTAEMYEIIRNINRQGVAIVTVSHDVGQALRDAKHVLVMERTVRFYGETEAYEAWRRENG